MYIWICSSKRIRCPLKILCGIITYSNFVRHDQWSASKDWHDIHLEPEVPPQVLAKFHAKFLWDTSHGLLKCSGVRRRYRNFAKYSGEQRSQNTQACGQPAREHSLTPRDIQRYQPSRKSSHKVDVCNRTND